MQCEKKKFPIQSGISVASLLLFLFPSLVLGAAPIVNSVHSEYSSSGVPIALRIVGKNLCVEASCAKKPEIKISGITLSDLTIFSDMEIRVDVSAVRDGNYVLSISTGVQAATFPVKIQMRTREPMPSVNAPNLGFGWKGELPNESVASSGSKKESIAAPLVPPTDAVNFFRKTTPPYPLESRRLQEEGAVVTEIQIAESGWASCRIVESSGTKRLDDATVEWCATKKFDPATRLGVPEKFTFKLKYTFHLDSSCSDDMVKNANVGDASAQFDLAECFMFGGDGEKNPIEAMKWYRLAAEKGHAESQEKLGLVYFSGTGVEVDYREAMKWLRKSANQDDPIAQGAIGVMYEEGLGVEKDYSEAARWYRLASAKSFEGSWAVQFQLGKLYRDGKGVNVDNKEAERLFRLASSKSSDAQSDLGMLYKEGLGVTRNYGEAARLFALAAAQGNNTAKIRLATLYSEGLGVKKNPGEAIRLVRDAAKDDDPYALGTLASYYLLGIGVKKDLSQGFNLMLRAAKNKNSAAQGFVGEMYYDGIGVKKDIIRAFVWLTLASAGDYNADELKNKLIIVERKISLLERTEAEKLIKQCTESKFSDCP